MPELSGGDLLLLRSERHRFKEYLAVMQPAVVLACQLDGAPEGDPVTSITYDNVTEGAFGNVVIGMTLWVGTSAGGRQKGTCRIRKAATADTLYIAEDSAIDWEDDDYLTVVENYEFWLKYPRIIVNGDITFYKDWEVAYSDQHSNWAPVAILGPPDCQFIDPGTGLATCKFVGEHSYAVAPGATIPAPNYAWTFPSGTPNSANTAGTDAAPHTVTWDTPGIYWVTLTVTDSNGKTHTGRRPVFIFSRTGESVPYTRFKMLGRSGDLNQHGHTASFEIHSDADQAEFPDGAMVVYFTEDWYGDTQQGIGGNFKFRAHIKFVGYIQKESTTKDPQTSLVTFEAATINALMDTREGFSAWIETKSSASNWCEATNLTADRAALSLCRYNSTLLDIADVRISGDGLYIKSQEFGAKTSLLQQLQILYDDLFAHVACDKQGSVYFDIDIQLRPVDDRGTIPIIADLQHGDWRGSLDLPRPQEAATSFINLAGVYYPGYPAEVEPILSKAPGDAPAYQGRTTEISGLILAGQSDGNTKSGLALARDNNQFPDVTLPMAGLWEVFDIVPQEYVRLSLAAADTKRGIVWVNQKLIPRRVNLDVEDTEHGRVPRVTIQVEKDSYGPPGVDGDYPDEVPDSDWNLTPYPPLPPPPPGGVEGSGNSFYFVDYTSGHLFRSRNAKDTPTSVVYEDLGYVSSKLVYIALDPWDPKETAIILSEDTGVWKITNLDSGYPDREWKLDIGTAITLNHCAASICQQGLWLVTGYYTLPGVASYPRYWRSKDGGETWSSSAGFDNLEGRNCRAELSSHDASKAWITWERAVAKIDVAKSTDFNGAGTPTWSHTNLFTNAWDAFVAAPYHRYFQNSDDLIALYGGEEQPYAKVQFCTSDTSSCTKKTIDAGNDVDDQTHWVGGHTWSTVYWALTWGPAGGGYRFHISDNGIDWTLQYTFPGTTRFISGFSYDRDLFYATQNGVSAPLLLSTDRGATWQAQTGNWSDLGYNGDIRCCVPVWID